MRKRDAARPRRQRRARIGGNGPRNKAWERPRVARWSLINDQGWSANLDHRACRLRHSLASPVGRLARRTVLRARALLALFSGRPRATPLQRIGSTPETILRWYRSDDRGEVRWLGHAALSGETPDRERRDEAAADDGHARAPLGAPRPVGPTRLPLRPKSRRGRPPQCCRRHTRRALRRAGAPAPDHSHTLCAPQLRPGQQSVAYWQVCPLM